MTEQAQTSNVNNEAIQAASGIILFIIIFGILWFIFSIITYVKAIRFLTKTKKFSLKFWVVMILLGVLILDSLLVFNLRPGILEYSNIPLTILLFCIVLFISPCSGKCSKSKA